MNNLSVSSNKSELHFYIYVHSLPILHRRLKSGGIRLRQRQPVQQNADVPLIGGRMDLIRHVIGVIPFAAVRQYGIDNQRVRGLL